MVVTAVAQDKCALDHAAPMLRAAPTLWQQFSPDTGPKHDEVCSAVEAEVRAIEWLTREGHGRDVLSLTHHAR